MLTAIFTRRATHFSDGVSTQPMRAACKSRAEVTGFRRTAGELTLPADGPPPCSSCMRLLGLLAEPEGGRAERLLP